MSKDIKSQDTPRERATPGKSWAFALALAAAIAAILALAIFNLETADRQIESTKTHADNRVAEEDAAVTEMPTVPSFDVVRISRGGTGVLAGRAAPDSLVELLVDDMVAGTVRSDRNGEWVMILEEPLSPGTVELALRATLDGEDAVPSDDLVVVAIPEPLVPERFVDREGEGVVAVLTPKSGEGASRVLQKPGLAAPGEVGDSLAVDTIDYGADGSTTLTGRAIPRGTVRVYLDNDFIAEVRANDDGFWSVQSDKTLNEGDHIVRVDQVIEDGQVKLRVVQPFDTGVSFDPQLAERRVVVQPGNTLWTIARKLYGRGTRFTMIFQENSEQIVDPDLIYPGQLFRIPGAPQADANKASDDEGSRP